MNSEEIEVYYADWLRKNPPYFNVIQDPAMLKRFMDNLKEMGYT